jgi:TolA-binding protein
MRIAYVVLCASLIAAQSHEISPKDAFFLRRITEFWKDKDYALVKKQITEFLASNPQTSLSDNLYAILGDLSFQEGNISDALASYQKIQGQEFRQKTLEKHVRCLHAQQNWAEIIHVASPFFQEGNKWEKEEVQYLLGEALYRELAGSGDLAQKETFAKLAKPILQSFTSEEYKEFSRFPLAEVHRTLKEYPQAASLYMILAEKNPDQAQDLFFQAATLQLEFDKNEALKVYSKILEMGGEKAKESAFNILVLLYQEGQFEELVARKEAIAQNIAQDKTSLFYFCIGRSYFELGNWSKAVLHFEEFVKDPNENTAYQKNAFLSLLSCAQKMHDLPLFDRTLEQLILHFPSDSETAKALLLHAQFSLEQGNPLQATSDLDVVLTRFPEFGAKENLVYDHALLLAQTKNWAKSRAAFLSYLDQFPETSHADMIWSYILNCSIQEVKGAGNDTLNVKKEQFANDLQSCLCRETLFSSDERVDYHFILGKTLYELNKMDEAIAILEKHVRQHPQHPTSAEAHLLIALAYQDSSPKLFAEHAEAALALNEDITDRGALHLQLFNSYLAQHDTARAAAHLFQSYIVEKHLIQRENQLWLSNYYYEEAKNDPSAREKAITLFQRVLNIQDGTMELGIAYEESFLEAEALKLAQLLEGPKKSELLSTLIAFQENHPDFGWKFQRQALFELGKSYETCGECDQALQIFDKIIHSSSLAPSYFSNAAQLEKTRLLYARCPEKERVEENEKMIQILSTLKDLQIQKKLLSEPIHLEAALDYADIRVALSSSDSEIESSIFFLNRIKEDFNSKDDLAAREYHEARSRLPEKDQLFQNYMKCIEAEMIQLEACLAKKQSDKDKAKQNEEVAALLFQELLAVDNLTPYLKSRVEENLKALNNAGNK